MQSHDLERPSRMEAWCLPPLPVINDVAARFAESASNFGRQIAKVVEETVAPLPPSSTNVAPRSFERPEETSTSLGSVIPSPTGGDNTLAESSGLLSNLGVEQATAFLSSTNAALMKMGQNILAGPPAAWNGLVSRVQTTLRGSADDIGWLQRIPGALPVEDGTSEFLQALDTISHGVHILPNTVIYLLIPGLFSNHGPLYFVDTKKYFSKLGLHCHIAKIHSEAAVEVNAKELKEHIEELYWGSQMKIVLLGHSKGGVDAAAACSMFWDDLKDKVVALALVQSPYGGSPVASDILREGQIADFETRRIMEVLISKLIKLCKIAPKLGWRDTERETPQYVDMLLQGDIQALEDLTYEKRRQFLAKYTFPSDLPVICFHTEASRSPGWLATMSQIAQADLPWLPGGGSSEQQGASAKLPVAVPLAAAMAVCALHLEIRYGEKGDGLVMRKDAEVPGSIVVRLEKKLDHGWMVYSPARKDPLEPDAAQMCEALLTLVLNHERWKRHETPVTPQAEASLRDAQAAASRVLSKKRLSWRVRR